MNNINIENVTVNGKFKLGASVFTTDKSKKSPAVVIIPGTGNLDRFGNSKKTTTDFYKIFAEEFTKNGFVSVVYDKRGIGESEGKHISTTLDDLVDDAAAVLNYTRALPYVDENKVIVCGHSEGTMISSLLSQRETPAAFVLIGGAGMCLRDALIYQYTQLGEELQNKNFLTAFIGRKMLSPEKSRKTVNKLFDSVKGTKKDVKFTGTAFIPGRYFDSHGKHSSEELSELLKKCTCPILAVTGTSDFNADFHALSTFDDTPNICTFAPENVTHLLRERMEGLSILNVNKDFENLRSRPMHHETITFINNWMTQTVS